jgi:hypothetical protein
LWRKAVRKLHIPNGPTEQPRTLFGGYYRGMIYPGFSNIPKNDGESSVCHAFGFGDYLRSTLAPSSAVQLCEIQLVKLLKNGLRVLQAGENKGQPRGGVVLSRKNSATAFRDRGACDGAGKENAFYCSRCDPDASRKASECDIKT